MLNLTIYTITEKIEKIITWGVDFFYTLGVPAYTMSIPPTSHKREIKVLSPNKAMNAYKASAARRVSCSTPQCQRLFQQNLMDERKHKRQGVAERKRKRKRQDVPERKRKRPGVAESKLSEAVTEDTRNTRVLHEVYTMSLKSFLLGKVPWEESDTSHDDTSQVTKDEQ